jgi:predicted TPR repeat methyltransferase
MTADAPEFVKEVPEDGVEVTAAEFLAMGKRAHQNGKRDAAREIYETLLQADPDHSEVQHFLGLLLHQMGEVQAGMTHLERSLKSPNASAGWWSNYGNILRAAQRPNDAIDAYKEAIRLDPTSHDAFNNLGVVQKNKYNVAIALDCFRKAVELQPEFGVGWSNLGHLLISEGEMTEGIPCLMRAIALSGSTDPADRPVLAFAHSTIGEPEKARDVYRRWLEEDPKHPVALHHLAAVSGDTPPRADDAYVKTVFDNFAETFDQKLAYLKYSAPELVVAEVAAEYGTPQANLLIADAGCGTGLCAPGLRPYAHRLGGVDISERMIEKAKARGGYDALAVSELTFYFAKTPDRFDAIVSADTLCYFGDLAPPFAAFRRCLEPGGILVFTVEVHDAAETDFKVNYNGRYTHSEAYVRARLEAEGMAIVTCRMDFLRMEVGYEVKGLVVRARAPLGG